MNNVKDRWFDCYCDFTESMERDAEKKPEYRKTVDQLDYIKNNFLSRFPEEEREDIANMLEEMLEHQCFLCNYTYKEVLCRLHFSKVEDL